MNEPDPGELSSTSGPAMGRRTEVIIVRAVQTCSACPSQWDAWDMDGHYWYLRYRHGHGTAERQPGPGRQWDELKEPEISFQHGDRLSGFMLLEEFCERAGLNLALRGDMPTRGRLDRQAIRPTLPLVQPHSARRTT